VQACSSCLEAERRDTFSHSKVAAGYALAEAYSLNESPRAEYEATKATNP